MFTAALLTEAEVQRLREGPPTGERVTQRPYVREFYSTTRTNDILPFATTRMGLEGILPSEKGQRKANTV